MSLISSIARGAVSFRADVAGADPGFADFWYRPMGWGRSTGGMHVSAETAKSLATVYACVSIIGRNIAQLPAKPYKLRSNGGKSVNTKSPLFRLLSRRPNQWQTPFEFRMMMQGHAELRGNAYAEIIFERGVPVELRPLHPDRVRVEVLSNGMLRYQYRDRLQQNQERAILGDDMFHLRLWSEDGYVGQSTIESNAGVYGVAIAQQDYSSRFFQNDAKPSTYITGGNFKNDEERSRFREKWQEQQTGANRHKTAFMPAGMEIKELGVKPSDAQLLEARKFSRIELCSLYGVPGHLIGETEKTATYASVEQFNIMFAVQCLLPRAVMWEQALHRDLGMDDDEFVLFDFSALLRGDNATRTAAEAVAIASGWMNQDEVREIEGMNPIPNGMGQDYWRPMNWARLSDPSVTAQKQLAASSGNDQELEDLSVDDNQNDDSGGSARLAGMVKILAHMAGKSPEEATAALKRMMA